MGLLLSVETQIFYYIMPKTKDQKQQILNQLTENVASQKAIVFVDYKGLKVGDMTVLRKQLKEAGSKLIVTKKTLLSKILKDKGIDANLKGMDGQLGAIFAHEDPVVPMKTVHTFGKQNENLKILGGYFENERHDVWPWS